MASNPLMDALRTVNTTPQNQPIPTRTDQVKNSAGGYVFAVDDWTRLHRFLIMGTTGGTYYIDEQKLTADNAAIVFRLLDEDGLRVVKAVVTISENGDAPKQDPGIFTLAAAASHSDVNVRRAALDALPRVCRYGTTLFQFVSYTKELRGWGRTQKRAVADWYLREPGKIAYQAVKYRQRDGWTHRDLLRKSHPKPQNDEQNVLFRFMAGHYDGGDGNNQPIVAAYQMVNDPATTVAQAAELALRLPWEALPDRFMNEPAVWDALLDSVNVGALLRQLPRLTRIGLIKQMGPLDARLDKLRDIDTLRSARLHPVTILNALHGYKAGRSTDQAGTTRQTWDPVAKVLDLLDDAFHASFGAITPSGKRTMVALDISGSMWGGYGGVMKRMPNICPAQGAAAMAMATVRTEPECMVVGFAHQLEVLPITERSSLADVDRIMRDASGRMGRTDCALPMLAAQQNKLDVDTFVVYTDNETWAGRIHPTQALKHYRHSSGINAREAVVGMTSTGFSIADPTDAGQLDLVGFDASTPQILAGFSSESL